MKTPAAKIVDALDRLPPLDVRFNDWTSDRVEGKPIEVFVQDDDKDNPVIARYPITVGLTQALLRERKHQRIEAVKKILG